MNQQLPRPETTLVIILGASEFPKANARLSPSPSFERSASGIREYFVDVDGYGLPPGNLLYLFDSIEPSSHIDEKVRDFLVQRVKIQDDEFSIKDLLVYYVGHGGFSGGGADYYLALRDTRLDNDLSTSYSARSLARTLKEYGRDVRKYLILDCCFSAAAYTEFMSTGPLQVASQKVNDELPPEKGTALLCASGARDPARAPRSAVHTMFTGALLQVLRRGEQSDQKTLSFAQVAEMTEVAIKNMYAEDAVRPEIHFPDQRLGGIGKLPFFPNPVAKLTPLDAKINGIASTVSQLVSAQEAFRRDMENVSSAIAMLTAGRANIGNTGAVNAKYEDKLDDGYKRIGIYKIRLSDWQDIPANVKREIGDMVSRQVNGAFWSVVSFLVLFAVWYPWPFTNRIFEDAAMVANLFLAFISSIGVFRRSHVDPFRGETSGGPWINLDVVLELQRSRSVEVIPGFPMHRRVLAIWAVILVCSALVSLAMFFAPVRFELRK